MKLLKEQLITKNNVNKYQNSIFSKKDIAKQSLYKKLSELKCSLFGTSMSNTNIKINLTQDELDLFNEIIELESNKFKKEIQLLVKEYLPFEFGKNNMVLPMWNTLLAIFDMIDKNIVPNLSMTLIINKK